MASVLDGLKFQIAKAREEYKAKKKAIDLQIAGLEQQSAQLDRDYAVLDAMMGRKPGRKPGARGPNKSEYGGVRSAVLAAISSGKGVKPAQIVEKTGLESPQVHNALTGLKKSKEVKVKDGLYHAT